MFGRKNLVMPEPHQALPGRPVSLAVSTVHWVNGHSLLPPYPEGTEKVLFGMGCFWGAERRFWQLPGVYVTAAGYAGGYTPNASYEEVCSGLTGHAEVVLVVYDPLQVSLVALLKVFWESHDPTQGMRQGNDIGTQYRSVVYTFEEAQRNLALASRDAYRFALEQAGKPAVITTEVGDSPAFYYAETYHQQYLAKNPDGYCGLRGSGIVFDLEKLPYPEWAGTDPESSSPK
jgi:peptide-methionine (S)-S-oxide reductase